MALLASNALPPPKPITNSHCWRFASRTPCSTVSTSGSPKTEDVNASRPWSRKSPSKPSARLGSRPVTTSALRPNCFASDPVSRTVPTPKMIRVGVANSNRIGKHVRKFLARARLSHHGRDGIPPGLVMFGFLMCRRRAGRAIAFHQDKSRGLILLLENVEPGNARLLETFLRIGNGGPLKSLHRFRFYVNVNMNDKH